MASRAADADGFKMHSFSASAYLIGTAAREHTALTFIAAYYALGSRYEDTLGSSASRQGTYTTVKLYARDPPANDAPRLADNSRRQL